MKGKKKHNEGKDKLAKKEEKKPKLGTAGQS